MERLVIKGKQRIKGTIKVNGAKNAAVAVIPASLLTEAAVKIENLPEITDINWLIEILKALGAKVSLEEGDSLQIDSSGVHSFTPPQELVDKFRASYYFMGALLGRFGQVEIPMPGGCNLGPRPIDQHMKGFTALGAKVDLEHGLIKIRAKKLKGAHIYLDVISVGATINIMLAAARAEGKTIIENAAKEPEIVDVANLLNAMGAQVIGTGTDIIKIQGVPELGGAEHNVIPDRIEAGTFMIAAAATGGELLVEEVIPKHLDPVIAKLKEIGVPLAVGPDWIKVLPSNALSPADVKTFPYPGFPTDLQAPMMVLLTQAPGISFVSENVFEGRFRHVDELRKMGARIKLEGRTAIVEGGHELISAPLRATDLRGGAALVIAGMLSKGETILEGVEHIDRGYELFEERLNLLGAKIERRIMTEGVFPGK